MQCLAQRQPDGTVARLVLCARRALRQVVQGQQAGFDPRAVRLLVGEGVLDLVVEQDAVLVGVHEQHLPGAEAARYEHHGRVDVERADLARQDETVVVGHVVARRAQAVAVERGAHHVPVGKRDGGRAIPRLHEHRLVRVPRAALLGQRLVFVPRLGQHHRHRARQAAPVHGEELEHVVEHGAVGALVVDHGQDALQVVAHDGAEQLGLARVDPVHVAAQGVDLSVVDDVAVGMRALPRRRRVGGVARMDECDGRLGGCVVEVGEEPAHLRGDEHALVDDGARAHRAHVEDLVRQLDR